MKQLVSLGAACVSVAARVRRDAEQVRMKQLVSLGTACLSSCGCTRVWHDAEQWTLSANFSWTCLDNIVGEQRLKSSNFLNFFFPFKKNKMYC